MSDGDSDGDGPLVQFLANDLNVDRRVIATMTDMGLETLDDFAHFWTGDDYEQGMQEIVASTSAFEDLRRPASRFQVTRLQHAWEMKRLGRPPDPTSVGFGVVSDVLDPDCSYTSVSLALEMAVLQPWRIHDVEEASCELRWCEQERTLERRLRLAEGEFGDRVFPREELGEVVFRPEGREAGEAGAGAFWRGLPPAAEAVLQLHLRPLRLELFARAGGGARAEWRGARHDEAREALEEVARLAREAERAVAAERGPEDRSAATPEALWRAMRSPELRGALEGDLPVAAPPLPP